MSSTNTLPVIAGVQIACDSVGRYNINALHRAAGAEMRHQPSNWLSNQQTQEIIADIEAEEGKAAVSTVQGGIMQGTFVHKELAYSYAMWISPKFHRQVVKTFDAVLSGDFDRALSEAQRAKVAFYEDAKRNKTIPADVCEFQIAYTRGDSKTLELLEQKERDEQQAKQNWRENTVEGFVATRMADVWAGYEETVDVPAHLDAAKVQQEIESFMKKRDIACRFTLYNKRRSILVETC